MKRAAILALFIVVPNLAQAATNFPALTDYPAPNCAKPGDKPVMAKDAPRVVLAGGMSITTGAHDVKGYNKQIAAYNAALAAYTVCMNVYVDNGQADMNAIRDKVNQAVAAGKIP